MAISLQVPFLYLDTVLLICSDKIVWVLVGDASQIIVRIAVKIAVETIILLG